MPKDQQMGLTAEELKRMLSYDPETGVFSWVSGYRKELSGSIAGCDNGNGYIRIRIAGQLHYAPRLAFLFMEGSFPKNEVDHINCIRSDNRWVNLRHATRTQNCGNVRVRAASGLKGVSNTDWGWKAQIRINGKNKHIGYFDSKEMAAQAYKNLATKYFGEFANV